MSESHRNSDRYLMKLEDKVEKISTKEDFSSFIDSLKVDLKENPTDWENPQLDRFLDAMSAWVLSMENVNRNLGREVIVEPTWKTFGEILLAAKFYE